MVTLLTLSFVIRYFAISSVARKFVLGELLQLLFLIFLFFNSYSSIFLSRVILCFMTGYILGMIFPKVKLKSLSLRIVNPRLISSLTLVVLIFFIVFSIYLIVTLNSNISQFRYLLFDSNTGLAVKNNLFFTFLMYGIWTISGLYLVSIVITDKPILMFILFMLSGMLFLSRNIIVLAILGILLRVSLFKQELKFRYIKRGLIPVLIILVVVLGNRGLIRSVVGLWEYNSMPLQAFELLAKNRINLEWPWYSSFRGIELAINPFLEMLTGTNNRITSQQIVGPVYDYAITLNGSPWNAFYSGFATPYFSLGLKGVFMYGLFFRVLFQFKNQKIQYLFYLVFYFGFRLIFFEDPSSIFLVLLWLM